MMRIISEGKNKKPEIMECDCGCKFEYNEYDIETNNQTQETPSMFAFGAGRDVTRYRVTGVKCPWCHKYNKIEVVTLSSEWEPWRF